MRNKFIIFVIGIIVLSALTTFFNRAVPYNGTGERPYLYSEIVDFGEREYLILLAENTDWARTYSSTKTSLVNGELHITFMTRDNRLPSLNFGYNYTNISKDWVDVFSVDLHDGVNKVTHGSDRRVLWTRTNGLTQLD